MLSDLKGHVTLDPVLLIWGMSFMENHFSLFKRNPLSGVIMRNFWLVGVMLLTMAYHGVLKVWEYTTVYYYINHGTYVTNPASR